MINNRHPVPIGTVIKCTLRKNRNRTRTYLLRVLGPSQITPVWHYYRVKVINVPSGNNSDFGMTEGRIIDGWYIDLRTMTNQTIYQQSFIVANLTIVI